MSTLGTIMKRTLFLLFLLTAFILGCLGFLSILVLGQIPSSQEIKGCFVTKMNQVNICPEGPDYVKLNSVSGYLRKAVVITEDSAFFNHQGFDFQEIQNSIEKNLKEKKFKRGGSTISQQLAKNMFLTREKTITRKLLEAVITIRIESTLTKNEILEKYFNIVQFGKDIFGVKKAAKFYFNKRPSELDVVESAFLTFLLPNPEGYSKSYFKKSLTPFARQRLNTIIERLYLYQRISEDDYQQAQAKMAYFPSGQAPPEEAIAVDADKIIEEMPESSDSDSELFLEEN